MRAPKKEEHRVLLALYTCRRVGGDTGGQPFTRASQRPHQVLAPSSVRNWWTAVHCEAPIPTNKCPKNPPCQENTIHRK